MYAVKGVHFVPGGRAFVSQQLYFTSLLYSSPCKQTTALKGLLHVHMSLSLPAGYSA